MSFKQFFEDSDGHKSMSRLGMFIGMSVGGIIALGAAILYFCHSLDAAVFLAVHKIFAGTTSGGYGIGKVADIFDKTTPTESGTEEDATP